MEQTEFKQEPVANVGQVQLFEKDLVSIVPEGSSFEDSVRIINEYVQQWVRKQLILAEAEKNLNELPHLERQVKAYREDLLIYAYEKSLVQSKVDTAITPEELESFYHQVKDNFKLKGLIMDATCLSVPKGAPKMDSIKFWLKYPRDRYQLRLEEYAMQYGAYFHLAQQDWLHFEDIQKELRTVRIYQPRATLKYRSYFETEDSLNKYYLRVHDYKLEGDYPPIGLIKEKLKVLLHNQRKTAFLQEMYETLLKKAFSANQFNIRTNDKAEK